MSFSIRSAALVGVAGLIYALPSLAGEGGTCGSAEHACGTKATIQAVAGEAKSKSAQVGQEAPAFTLTAHDGKEISLADLNGKIVVLEWFNEQCPFVVYHYDGKDTFRDLAKYVQDKGGVYLAVNSSNFAGVDHNKKVAGEWKINYPILDDSSGKVGKKYGAATTPHMYVIDSEGVLRYAGAIDNAPNGKIEGEGEYINYVKNAVDELASGKTVTVAETKPYGCSVKYKAGSEAKADEVRGAEVIAAVATDAEPKKTGGCCPTAAKNTEAVAAAE